MLTKDKLDRIVNYPYTQEDHLIKRVYQAGGVLTEYTDTDLLHARKSLYLEYSKEGHFIKLNRKGKENRYVYDVPDQAENVHDYVYSLLCKEYSLTHKRTIPMVYAFCVKRNIPIGEYINNPNIHATIKKQVKKYLQSKGLM